MPTTEDRIKALIQQYGIVNKENQTNKDYSDIKEKTQIVFTDDYKINLTNKDGLSDSFKLIAYSIFKSLKSKEIGSKDIKEIITDIVNKISNDNKEDLTYLIETTILANLCNIMLSTVDSLKTTNEKKKKK